VITLEPGVDLGQGTIMVHEEDVVVTEDAPRVLSPMTGPDLPVI